MEYIDLSNAREIYYGGVAVSQVYLGDKLIYPSYFTIESISSGNTISLTYVNGLDDTTGYPSQIEADIWVDNAVSASTVVIPMNVTTTLATLDDGHKMRVYIHNHNLQNSYDDNVYINFGSTEEFNAYGTISSLLEDNKTSSRWVGLFRESKVADISNLVLPNEVLAYDYSNFCYSCTSLTEAPKLPATILANYCYSHFFDGCTTLTSVPSLPATVLKPYCYDSMFQGCTSITTVPTDLLPNTVHQYSFQYMFKDCTSLTNVPNLSATTLSKYCYRNMFENCTSLTTVPTNLLPATSLLESCYSNMFKGCTSLIVAPELPATTFSDNCYRGMFIDCTALTTAPSSIGTSASTMSASGCSYMFSGCTSLTTAPELPALTMASHCYNNMFYSCTSLTVAPSLPSTSLGDYCYRGMFNTCTSLLATPELPATILKAGCYFGMFAHCKALTATTSSLGTSASTVATSACSSMYADCPALTTAPELPSTSIDNYCYKQMFSGCTSMVNVPHILPATTLKTACYDNMFTKCSFVVAPVLPAKTVQKLSYQHLFSYNKNLRWVKALLTTTPNSTYTPNWLYGVTNTSDCTFVKNENATWTTVGNNGIPSNWVVQTCAADDYSYPTNI